MEVIYTPVVAAVAVPASAYPKPGLSVSGAQFVSSCEPTIRSPVPPAVFDSRVNGIIFRMDNEAQYLQQLLNACHRVLPHVEGEDEIADAIRETCRTVEARLRELGVNGASPPS